jgi:hypothetical protein
MPIQQGIWKIGSKPEPVKRVALDSEAILEDQIFSDIEILNKNWLIIGRQVLTDYGKYIDLLAIDGTGSVIVIELKKNKTPREVTAQALDYASWVNGLPSQRFTQIYADMATKYGLRTKTLDEAFLQRYGQPLSEDELNNSHLMVIVAAELDSSTERIINYLNDTAGVPINAVFFTVFEEAGQQYLSRVWMIDPVETEERAVNTGKKGTWNGEYYASFGASADGRNWEDAMKYGFISAGGGDWYSKTLKMLKPGDRVWVNIPKTGYVGVGEVTGSRVIADEFLNDAMNLLGNYNTEAEYDEDRAEFFVPVKWLKAVPQTLAVSELGFFGNQNSVCTPKTDKWTHTVKRLREAWGV